MIDLSDLTHEHFEACLEKRFLATDAGTSAMELLLHEVRPRGAFDPEQHKRRAFALTFAGPAEPVLAQGVYTLHNETLGEMGIFLVPVGPQGEHMLYEAVFT